MIFDVFDLVCRQTLKKAIVNNKVHIEILHKRSIVLHLASQTNDVEAVNNVYKVQPTRN